jgi:hypothetical protein
MKRHPGSCHQGKCDLIVAIYGDHAVYGASDNERADSPRFWQQLLSDGEPFALFHAHDVPEEIASDLIAQGTQEQAFHDGYTAFHAVQRYLRPIPFWVSPESDLRLDIAPGIPVRGSVKSLHPIYDRTRGELNVPEGYAVRLQHIGRSQFNAVDPLAIYVPERLTHDYALHPHAWRWTFGALTGKDGKKIRYYKPVLVPIRPGTLVAEMKFASRFLHDPEDVESARLYQSSVQPLKTANLSDYEQPELLIPRTQGRRKRERIP